jgi:hypothetical protein
MKRPFLLPLLTAAVVISSPAKDAINASVTPVSGPTPIVLNNGNPYSNGTFAVGTIQLFYTVKAFQFPSGQFATFQVGLRDQNETQNPTTMYPVTLNLVQTGSANLTLTPVPASFNVTGTGWSGSSLVTVSIPSAVAQDPSLNVDGTDLVGNLQLETSPQGAHLDTVTTIQVHIKLIHPTACLRLFDFVTDEAFTTTVTSTLVQLGGHPLKVVATNPFGQFSDNLLVVNTCGVSESFDIKAGLDGDFQTTPHGNPGNAVFTYLTSGYVDPNSFNVSGFGTGTPEGEQLCLTGISVPAGDAFLMTVHMGIDKGMSPSLLPSSNTFTFSGGLYAAGSACSGTPDSLATPNPVSTSLSFATSQ